MKIPAVVLLALLGAAAAQAADPVPTAQTRIVEPVNYEALADKVGREIVVTTTFRTKRRGTLEKVTKSSLILRMNEKAGGIQLDLPRNTVRAVELVGESVPAVVEDDRAKKK
jgi:hypothetical protein